MKHTFLKTVAAVALTAVSASAASAQLVGTVNLTGGQVYVASPTLANGMIDPNAPVNIDFVGNNVAGVAPAPSFGTPNGPFTVTGGTGIFAGLGGTSGIITDLRISNGGATIATVGAPQLFTIGGYTFTVNTTASTAPAGDVRFGPIVIRNGPVVNGIPSSVAELFLGGTVTGNNLQGGVFGGSITAQFAGLSATDVFNRANNQGGSLAATSYSASFGVAVIPEPSTYALLATGIAGLGVFARRRRQQA